MTTRDTAPLGAPCWVDLWTSDVQGSRVFYSALFGWEAQEPSSEFGGYFMFTRDGVPVAGAMGAMGDTPAGNIWTVYLACDDIDKTLEVVAAEGGDNASGAMHVADLGTQALLVDPNGARLGTWQPGTFPGFTVLGEPGAPSWFELLTREHARAVGFYRSVFHWDVDVVSDTDEFRYAVQRDGDDQLAGIGDATSFLPDGVPAYWSVYWHVDDVDKAVTRATSLGGSVVIDAADTPYGRFATLSDPAGALFKLRTPNQ